VRMTKSKVELRKMQSEGLLDPKPGKDGGCATCGNPRPPLAERHKDPFCSAACARIYFEAKGVG